jgi:hypothetical protein
MDPSALEATAMNSQTMPPEHAKRIGKSLRPSLNYLTRLRERMVAVGFLPDDPLFVAVVKAHAAMGELFMAMHYAGCASGVGGARMGASPRP